MTSNREGEKSFSPEGKEFDPISDRSEVLKREIGVFESDLRQLDTDENPGKRNEISDRLVQKKLMLNILEGCKNDDPNRIESNLSQVESKYLTGINLLLEPRYDKKGDYQEPYGLKRELFMHKGRIEIYKFLLDQKKEKS